MLCVFWVAALSLRIIFLGNKIRRTNIVLCTPLHFCWCSPYLFFFAKFWYQRENILICVWFVLAVLPYLHYIMLLRAWVNAENRKPAVTLVVVWTLASAQMKMKRLPLHIHGPVLSPCLCCLTWRMIHISPRDCFSTYDDESDVWDRPISKHFLSKYFSCFTEKQKIEQATIWK